MSAAAVVPEFRETIRCKSCNLNQFKTASLLCRKCGEPYEIVTAEPESIPTDQLNSEPTLLAQRGYKVDAGAAVKFMRHFYGWSQRDLAARLHKPRTYISKIENYNAEPNLSTVSQFASAFGMSERQFVILSEMTIDLHGTQRGIVTKGRIALVR